MEKMETIGNGVLGNTKPKPSARCVPSMYWCFTLNNWTQQELETLETTFKSLTSKFIIGKEVGDEGTPHLQGYVEFNKKVRPLETIKNERIHWEKRKGNSEQAINYCMKDKNFITHGIKIRKKVLDPMDGLELYEYQKEIMNIINQEPENDRKIYWFWEPEGNRGKTSFCKHLVMTRQAIYVNGKGADIKYAVSEMLKNSDIDIAIFDFVRTAEGYISYDALESIKNGIFFSGKYEGGMVLFNPPHMLCFANWEPNIETLSKDKWIIKRI